MHIYFTKIKESSRCILYSSIIFLSNHPNIWLGFLHRTFRILKVNINWIRVPTTDFARQKWRTRRENTNSIKPSWRSRNKPPKGHTKNIPFVLRTISKDKICDILYSIVEPSEQVRFGYNWLSVIVDNSENSHICS